MKKKIRFQGDRVAKKAKKLCRDTVCYEVEMLSNFSKSLHSGHSVGSKSLGYKPRTKEIVTDCVTVWSSLVGSALNTVITTTWLRNCTLFYKPDIAASGSHCP